MEEQISTGGIILNVVIQIANLVVFFLVFKFLLGDKIAKALSEREHLLKKIKNAESEYQEIISKAHLEKEGLIADGLHKQKQIIKEAEILSKKQAQEFVEDGKKKADAVLHKANKDAEKLQKDLADNREKGIKETSKRVVKKLLESDTELQEKYLDKVIKDI